MGRHMLFPGNFPTGNLSGGLAASGQPTFSVSGWGNPAGGGGQPFVVVINPGQSNEEKVACAQVTAGGVVTVDTRGWDGTTAVLHSSGEPVKIIWDATTAQDVDDHVYTTVRDDHTQYLNVTRHDITARHGATVVSHSTIGNLGNDDHTQYYNAARHDAHSHPTGVYGAATIPRGALIGMAGLPIGMQVVRHGGISLAEASYLLAEDGSTVLRATWPLLFAQIGTLYGAGDGSTTFGLPDSRDRVTLGTAGSAPDGTRSARAEAAVGGEETHLTTSAEMPAHSHSVSDSGHSHAMSDPTHAHAGVLGAGATDGWVMARNTGQTRATVVGGDGDKCDPFAPGSVGTGAAATGQTAQTGHAAVSAGNTGGGGVHNNMQPWIAVPTYIVAA